MPGGESDEPTEDPEGLEEATIAARPRASLAHPPAGEPVPAGLDETLTEPPEEPATVAAPKGDAHPEGAADPSPEGGDAEVPSGDVSTSGSLTGYTGLSGPSIVTSSGDFLRADDVNRIHAFSGGMNVVCLVGLGCVLALDGDPLATQFASIGLVVLWLGFATIWWISRDIVRYSVAAVGWIGVIMAVASWPMAYFFGLYSPFPCVVALAIYNYSLGSPLRYAGSTYAAAAIGQAVPGLLIAFGVIEDRGLIRSDGAVFLTLIVAQAAVQVVYGIAFLIGRVSAKRTRETVESLEAAVRQVAAREALLREARNDLERAAGIGEPGRFSEQRLGSYELGVIIGRGGMGEIYAATHVETGEPAAVKLLQRTVLQTDANPIERFEREAKLVASLESPHVVKVFEIGGALSPLPYLAMEHLVGHDLAFHLRERRRLKPAQVVDMVKQVAAGLMVTRERDIVHRDLKPQNLFRVEPEGVWKILDFGVSKLAGEVGTLTGGNLVGTPAYMAPEQATGDGTLDHRVDVYALAVIAYRCLTGRPAFTGKDLPRLIHGVVHSLPPRPSEVTALPDAVDVVLRVGLAKDADDRFDTAQKFANALAQAVRGKATTTLRKTAEGLNAEHAWGTTR